MELQSFLDQSFTMYKMQYEIGKYVLLTYTEQLCMFKNYLFCSERKPATTQNTRIKSVCWMIYALFKNG